MRPFLVKGLLNFFHLLSQTKKFRVAYEDGIIGEKEVEFIKEEVTPIAGMFYDFLEQHFGREVIHSRQFKLVILKTSSGYTLVDDVVTNEYPKEQYVFEITTDLVFNYISPNDETTLLSYSVDYISPRQALDKSEIFREITRYWQLSFYKDFDALLRFLNAILEHRKYTQEKIFYVIGTLMALTLEKSDVDPVATIRELRRTLLDLQNDVYKKHENVLGELDLLKTNLLEITKEWSYFLHHIPRNNKEDKLHIPVSNALLNLMRILGRTYDDTTSSNLTEEDVKQLYMPMTMVPSLCEFEEKCWETLGSGRKDISEDTIRISAYLQQLSEMYRLSDLLLPQFKKFWQLIGCLEAWINRYQGENTQLSVNKIELKGYAKKIMELCQPFKLNHLQYCKFLRHRGDAISECCDKFNSMQGKYLEYDDNSLKNLLTSADKNFLQRKYQEFLLFRKSWKGFLSDSESVKEIIKIKFASETIPESLNAIRLQLANDSRFKSLSEEQLQTICLSSKANSDIRVLRRANLLSEVWPVFIMEIVKEQLHREENGEIKEINDYVKHLQRINAMIKQYESFFAKIANMIDLEVDNTLASQETSAIQRSVQFTLPLGKK